MSVNTTNAPNPLRSANAPEMRQGVMAANISWKAANSTNGIVGPYVAFGSAPTPMKPA